MQFFEGASEFSIGWGTVYVRENFIVCAVHQTLLTL
jgi:hypothetical protein